MGHIGEANDPSKTPIPRRSRPSRSLYGVRNRARFAEYNKLGGPTQGHDRAKSCYPPRASLRPPKSSSPSAWTRWSLARFSVLETGIALGGSAPTGDRSEPQEAQRAGAVKCGRLGRGASLRTRSALVIGRLRTRSPGDHRPRGVAASSRRVGKRIGITPLELSCRASAQVGQVVHASVDVRSEEDIFRGSERRRWPASARRLPAAAHGWLRRSGPAAGHL